MQIFQISKEVQELLAQSLIFLSFALNIPKSPFLPRLLILHIPSLPRTGRLKGKGESSPLLFSAVR